MNYHEIKLLSQKLRKQPTEYEQQLWFRIRDRQLDGYKFLRQHPLIYDRNGNDLKIFIPDFYCAKARLVIEVDGGIHNRLN
jgi:very-short-patch-repair endonuclease